MRVSVLFAPRTPLKTEELEPPRAGEVRVRMVASGAAPGQGVLPDGTTRTSLGGRRGLIVF